MHNIKIKTERLFLRPLVVADADEVFGWVSDERVSRYMVYTTYTNIEEVKEWLTFVEKDKSTYNFGFERLLDGKLIGSGDIGLDRGFKSKEKYWGFGYNFRYDCWENGYATEANLAFGKVIEKCGLKFVKYGEWKKLDGSCKMKPMIYETEF